MSLLTRILRVPSPSVVVDDAVNAEQTAPAAPAAPSTHSDPVEQLTQLAALKDSGSLTDKEFEAQKARILG
jgi:hypothetical protein